MGKDTSYCVPKDSLAADSIKKNFSYLLQAPQNMHCIHWNGEEPNLDTFFGPILEYSHFHKDTFRVDTAGVYTLKLTNKTFCQMIDTVVVEEIFEQDLPQIFRKGDSLYTTTQAKHYDWYLNNNLYYSGLSSRIKARDTGNFSVKVPCTPTSKSYYLQTLLNPNPEQGLSFSLYPNPTHGDLIVKFKHRAFREIEVYNQKGQLIYESQEKGKNITINLNKAAAGTYYLKVTEGGKKGTKKFVVE